MAGEEPKRTMGKLTINIYYYLVFAYIFTSVDIHRPHLLDKVLHWDMLGFASMSSLSVKDPLAKN